MIHKPKHSINELTSAVNSLIGIPEYLSSTQKSQWRYGKDRLKTLNLKFVEFEKEDINVHYDKTPLTMFNEYNNLIAKNKFVEAAKYARTWYKDLQEDMGLRK